MLILTDTAAEVVKSITSTPQAPDSAGLRLEVDTCPVALDDLVVLAGPRRRGDLQRSRVSRFGSGGRDPQARPLGCLLLSLIHI